LVDPAGQSEKDLRSGLGRLFDELRAASEGAGDLDAQFSARKKVAETLEILRRERPRDFAAFARQLRLYTDHLEQARLRRHDHEVPPERLSARREAFKLTAYALAFGPVAVWGLLHNFVPYQLSKRAGLSASEEAIRAMTTLIAALIAFPGIYALYGWTLRAGFGWGVVATSVYLATLPPAGFFFLRYRRQLARSRDRLLARTFLLTQEAQARRLVAERERVVHRFEQLLEDGPRA
jgi:glycerol-3-phosphate O-acyltransferase / dihydroxyacetone phosphate acyltransferase